jgi:UDP-N-acetyl-D-glucosamine dehydrogenase
MTDMTAFRRGAAPAGEVAARLRARIESREAAVGIVGLGYVGLPLAMTVAGRGHRVLGFEAEARRLAMLAEGRSPLRHIPDAAVAALRDGGRFEATGDPGRLGEPDLLLLCVPTPLDRHRQPDLGPLRRAVAEVAARLRPGQLVVLESTTYPGTTAGLVRPALEAGGLACGRDVFLAHAPEREDPAGAAAGPEGVPRVVGADDPASLSLAAAFYAGISGRAVPVSSAAAAEAAKLTENVFRAVNVALVNELKLVFEAMGLDVWEVIGAAGTKPFGFMPFQPGPGIGGHCVAVDPFYLAWKAREHGVATRFIELAGEVNGAMPRHVVERLAEALDGAAGRGLREARVLVLGVAYKRNVDDLRESPSVAVMELLRRRGAAVEYHDPFVPEIPAGEAPAGLVGLRSVPWDAARIAGYDAVVVATDHDGVDYRGLAGAARLVVDTRNALARAGAAGGNVVKA